ARGFIEWARQGCSDVTVGQAGNSEERRPRWSSSLKTMTRRERLLADSLIEVGYGVMPAASAEVALQLLDVEAPDLVLSDVHMRGMSGIELCASLILT